MAARTSNEKMAGTSSQPDFFETSRRGVADTELRRKLESSTGRHLEHVNEVRSEFPHFDDERDTARRIKHDAISRLDELLVQLKQRLEANGCNVFVAANAAEARDYILKVARECGAKRVVKGKSMTTEELALNPALEQAGFEVVETDLGEYIVQLRGERPSHIITPAIHLSKEDIGHLFSETFGIPYTPEPEKLTAFARAATGQKLTTYTNFVSGPRRDGELDGPREMHVVILDNGRSSMLADPVLREALYCLRCGACLNVCPVYRRIGGHAYNSPYPGPIGSIVSPNLFGSAAAALPFASTLCGACRDICPVKIDIPRILLHLRWKANQGTSPAVQWPRDARRARASLARFARLACHPRAMRILVRLAALAATPLARDGYLRRMPGAFRNWTRTRDFPTPRARRWRARGAGESPGPAKYDPDAKP